MPVSAYQVDATAHASPRAAEGPCPASSAESGTEPDETKAEPQMKQRLANHAHVMGPISHKAQEATKLFGEPQLSLRCAVVCREG